MALTREEIREIADAVAERVVTPQLVCSCGYNALVTARSGMDLRMDIEAERKEEADKDLGEFLADVGKAEVACHIKLSDTREEIKKVGKAIQEGDWAEAQISAVYAENSIEEALHEAATK